MPPLGHRDSFRDDGELRWDLLKFLRAQGVRTKGVVLGEVIYEERRGRRYQGDHLRDLYFLASPQKRGEVLLGDDRQPVNALALYTTPQPKRAAVPELEN